MRFTAHSRKFQFHKGTIRTYQTDADYKKAVYFNSIKVRLERKKAQKIAYQRKQFQFHKGTIRTRVFCHYWQ